MIKKVFEMDLRTLADMFEAQPVVSAPDTEIVRALVHAMILFSNVHETEKDCHGTSFWMESLKDLVANTGLSASLEERKAGVILRSIGMVMHRRNDGTKVAWSEKQLGILKETFGLEAAK